MIKKAIWIGVMLSVVGLVSASNAVADEWDKKSILTFSQPFEIPGKVLPAGTYTFELADTFADRHIVRIFNKDRTEVLATVMTIPDYRLTPTNETVIKFGEVPAGQPEVIRAWFYPGNTLGQEFVYPKARAAQLARASKAEVPAFADDVAGADALKTAPIVAFTPDARETTVATAIQTRASSPAPAARATGVQQTGQDARNTRQLPQTASALPLVALLGLVSIGVAFGLMVFGKRSTESAT